MKADKTEHTFDIGSYPEHRKIAARMQRYLPRLELRFSLEQTNPVVGSLVDH